MAFDEAAAEGELLKAWDEAHARWQEVYEREEELLPSRLVKATGTAAAREAVPAGPGGSSRPSR